MARRKLKSKRQLNDWQTSNASTAERRSRWQGIAPARLIKWKTKSPQWRE